MEKKADVYLSLASLGHLLILGTGGAFVSELFDESPSFEVLYLSALTSIVFIVGTIALYAEAFQLAQNKKL